jgi:hypothetical protein
MFLQNGLQRLKLTSIGSLPRFLIMFIGVVAAPLMLVVIGGYNSNILGLVGSAWYFLTFALILLISIGGGVLMFRREFHASEMSIYQTETTTGSGRKNQSTPVAASSGW